MEYIDVVEGVSSGAPVIRGRRLTVFNIISKIYYEEDIDVAIEDYEINIDAATEAVAYCSSLVCQQDVRIVKFCSGCILRTLQDKWGFDRSDYSEFDCNKTKGIISISKDGCEVFLGSVQELEDTDFGKAGWLMASELKDKYGGGLDLNDR